MAEYLPVRKPGNAPTFKASATITGGQVVAITAGGQVVTAATPTAQAFVGIAETTATTGNKVRVTFVR
jgi:hypothetical protein